MKRLPLGIQSFSEIITRDYLYVDKTELIAQLLHAGKYFFLARPRRFGKSLLLSTIKEIYQGNSFLFKNLWIDKHWNWENIHPIIHVGFGSLGYKENGLSEVLEDEVRHLATRFEIRLEEHGVARLFKELIKKLYEARGHVVILIDEYDKPIIDYLGSDIEQAQKNQGILKNFFSVLKDSDPFIEFLLITGVSKFSKVSLFSDLNNLTDLSLNRHYATLLGITEEEIETYLLNHLTQTADDLDLSPDGLKEQVKMWYNGYSWDGKHFVYNPFSLLSFFFAGEFKNYWFETGTPSFLLDLMKKENNYRFDRLKVNESSFASYDIKRLRLLPLLFQTGYLTIKAKTEERYLLDYPNREVQQSMYQYIMGDLMHQDPAFTTNSILGLKDAFKADDGEEIIENINQIFAGIPHQIFIANQEAYYHSLLYITFQFLGNYTEAEVSTNRGRIDAVVHTATSIYILEFKLDQSAEAAIKQIQDRKYAEKYLAQRKQIRLLGINFNSEEKQITDWKMSSLPAPY